MSDVFGQIHAEMQNQAPPSASGDVFSQIHVENQTTSKGYVPNARLRNLPNPAEGMSPGRALYEGAKTGLSAGSLPAAAASPMSAVRALAGGTVGSMAGSKIAESA